MFKRIFSYISTKTNETGAQYRAYGIFGIFNFPFYYLFWLYLSPQTYENIFLRALCTILCSLLIFHKKWPEKLKKYLPLYWYITLSFTLPFFFTFMLIMNHGAEAWMTNTIVIVFFILLLVEWISAIVLLFVGSLAGMLAASFFTNVFFSEKFNYLSFFITYLVAVIIGIIFAHNKQMIEDIRRRSIKAEVNSQAKSKFISNMSHDLRTPITGMLGMAQDMLNAADQAEESLVNKPITEDSEVLRHLIKTVQRDGRYLMGATDELLQLYNGILEVVQLESGQFEEKFVSFSLSELIKHTMELLRPMAQHKNLTLVYDIDSRVPCYLKGSRIQFSRIFLNLISNAVKFTDEGGVEVYVKLLNPVIISGYFDAKTSIQILIKDTGIGIPSDKFETIFENFSRLSPAYEGLYKGAGLGLYMVKNDVEAMQGEIQVESELGKGSCFTVTLAFMAADHADADTPSNYASLMAKPPIENRGPLINHEATLPKETAASILVVEDNALAAIAVTLALNSFNCRVELAENGTKGVMMAQKEDYDLILMDVGLPDFSGIEATKKIRAFVDARKSQVPIVALTGHADNPEMRQEALDAGMQDVLSKPAQSVALEAIFQRYVFKVKDTEILPVSLEIIDWTPCVQMCQGNVAFTRRMLSMLAEDLKKTKIVLAQAYANRDLKTLRAELHRFCGGVCYLKLPQLDYALKAFHHAAKADPLDEKALENTYLALETAMDLFWDAWKMGRF